MQARHIVLVVLVGLSSAAPAWSHGDSNDQVKKKSHWETAHTDETPFGRAGDPRKASRTVALEMSDAMRFTPDRITVKQGETVRFVLRNRGKLLHEMVIGTPQALAEHAELMRKFPGMEHEEAYMAHVKPGGRGEIVWQFTKAGEFAFACLIPGHFEAGMKGIIVVGDR